MQAYNRQYRMGHLVGQGLCYPEIAALPPFMVYGPHCHRPAKEGQQTAPLHHCLGSLENSCQKQYHNHECSHWSCQDIKHFSHNMNIFVSVEIDVRT